MRILNMCYEFPPIGGGGGRVVNGLCRELSRAGDVVNIMTMRYDGLPKKEMVNGVYVHRIPCIRLKEYHCTIPEVATYQTSGFWYGIRLAHILRPNIIHAHFILPDGLLAWWAAAYTRTPFFITAHGSDVPGYNPHRAKIAHRLVSPIWRKTTRNANMVFCPSDSIRKLVETNASGANTITIPNGIDTDLFRNVKKRKLIIAVTRLLERKGIQYLIQAAKDDDLGWEITIVGDGPYLNELQRMANTSKSKIRFTGWLDNESDEFHRLYESSSIFVFPSEAENFPICLLEAMASRNAIVTSRGTGCEEVVGSTAWLVPPKDPLAIRKALNELTKNEELRVRMGNLAYERAKQRFSWPIVAEQYRSIYRKHLVIE